LQDHLKERLTGAAILVIAVVLLVPELFRGPPGTDSNARSGTAAGPPVRSYTIDLRDTATAQPPAASAPQTAAMADAADVPSQAAPSAHADAANNPSVAGIVAPAAPVANATKPPVAAPAATQSSARAAPSPHAGAVKSGWTVQVGSFARRDYAERMAKQVTAKGFVVEVAGPDDRGLYRVRSVPQPERAAAVALKQKMQASGLKPIVNSAP
jgi:cell division septation protein DedD